MASSESEDPYDEVEGELVFAQRAPVRARLKGQCPRCGVTVALRNRTGRLWTHGPAHTASQCPGSAGFPEPGSVRERPD